MVLLCDGNGILVKFLLFLGEIKKRKEALLLLNQVQTCFQPEVFNSPHECFDCSSTACCKKATLLAFHPALREGGVNLDTSC